MCVPINKVQAFIYQIWGHNQSILSKDNNNRDVINKSIAPAEKKKKENNNSF